MLIMDATLKCPFNMLVAGPSQSGKSTWVSKLLKYAPSLLEAMPKKIIWYSPHGQVPNNVSVDVRTCLPWETDEEEIEDDVDLVVLDDFAHETNNSRQLTKFLTQVSHHRRISVILLSQNLFWSGKETRTQSLNMHYIVLMRQTRDRQQIRTLARQTASNENDFKYFLAAYNDAIGDKSFSYLLVSVHPRDDPQLFLRTSIFPDESSAAIVYLRKNYKYQAK